MSVFTVAGVSINKGKVKVRFCSDLVLRIKNLQKQGDTDILLIELPRPMNKTEVCNFLLAHPSFSKYNTEINDVLGKKIGAHKHTEQSITALKKTEIDPEIEELKELAEA